MLATETLYTPYNGAVLLENPLLNKGLAFTQGERSTFNLQDCCRIMLKLLKNKRARLGQFCQFKRDISRHIYLRNIQDTNETLFYNSAAQPYERNAADHLYPNGRRSV